MTSAANLPLWNALLSWLGHPANEPAYAELRIPETSTDLTAALVSALEASGPNRNEAAPSAIASRLRAGRILLVPSYLSGPIVRWRDVRHDFSFLDPQLRRFRDEGYAADVVWINSAAPVQFNARLVGDAIRAADKEVFIVTHSKGGLDTLHALIEDPALRSAVGAFVPVQAPFYGSPVADLGWATSRGQWISDKVVRLRKGKLDAIHDLTTTRRLAYMREHSDDIAEIVSRIPILSIATTLDQPRSLGAHAVRLAPTTRWMQSLGFSNDGLVAVASTVLPGAPYASFDGWMHSEPEYELPGLDLSINRTGFLTMALTLALSHCSKSASESLVQ